MKEYRIGYDKLNFLLVNLKKGLYTKYWYEESKEVKIRRYYINFYDYILSQVEYSVANQIYTDRQIEDVLAVKRYVESFVNGSAYKDFERYERKFRQLYVNFIKDIVLLSLKINLTDREDVMIIQPTLPEEMIEGWEEKVKFEKDNNKVRYSVEAVKDYVKKFSGETDNEELFEDYLIGLSRMYYNDMPDTVVVGDLRDFFNSREEGKREVAGRMLLYYDIVKHSQLGIIEER